MGLFDKLFGGKPQPKQPQRPAIPTIASPRTARPHAQPHPADKPADAENKPAVIGVTETDVPSAGVPDAVTAPETAEATVAEKEATKAEEPVAPASVTAEETASEETAAVEETAVQAQEPPATEAVEGAENAEVAEAGENAEVAEAVEEIADSAVVEPRGEWDTRLQKRLNTYFARLREIFPDGEITRLNTGHKKLAERGAELRRLTGYDGRLDEFFALGGFVYRRGTGGRPALSAAQLADVDTRLRAQFPDGTPTVTQVRNADARLYLDVRAAARRDGVSVGDYLKAWGSSL